MTATDLPFVSAAVCTRNRSASLLRCLLSIVDQAWPPGRLELVVVDDASEDDTTEACSGLFRGLERFGYRRLHLERSGQPRGAAGARARALEAVSPDAEWILHIDDDAVLGMGALAAMARTAASQPRAGIVGPRLVFLSRPDLLCQGANYFGRWTGRYTAADPKEEVECDWINGTCLLVRAEASRQAGRLYSGFHNNHEDVEFSLSIQELGWKVLYNPKALVYHDAPLGLRPEGREYYLYRNKAIIIRRHLRGAGRWTALAFHLTFGWARAYVDAFRSGKLRELAPVITAAFRDALLDRRGRSWPPEASA